MLGLEAIFAYFAKRLTIIWQSHHITRESIDYYHLQLHSIRAQAHTSGSTTNIQTKGRVKGFVLQKCEPTNQSINRSIDQAALKGVIGDTWMLQVVVVVAVVVVVGFNQRELYADNFGGSGRVVINTYGSDYQI